MAITATNIINAQQILEQAWPGSQVEKASEINSATAQAVIANQQVSATFSNVLTNPNKDQTVHLMWFDRCFGGVVDCTPSCVLTGTGRNTLGQDYTLSLCKDTQVTSIGEEQWRTNQFGLDGAMAISIQQQGKYLDEFLSQQLLINFHNFAAQGKNFFLDNRITGSTYNQANGTTYIPDAQYNAALLEYFNQAAIFNRTRSNYKISDYKLAMLLAQAKIYATNLNGAGLAAQADLVGQNLTVDSWNFADAGITDDMFMIEKNAVAFLTKARFPTTPEYIAGDVNQWRWSQASQTLPGVYYDYYMSLTCDPTYSPTQEDIVHNLKARVHYGIFNNPLGCTVTRNGVTGKTTGVLSFTANATGVAPV